MVRLRHGKHWRATRKPRATRSLLAAGLILVSLGVVSPGTLNPSANAAALTGPIPQPLTLGFGTGTDLGAPQNGTTYDPTTSMAPTPSGNGYWTVASSGTVAAFGDAVSFGDLSALTLSRPIVAIVPTHSGKGYWLVGSDGGIFTFGDAQFFGSLGAIMINQPIVAGAATTDDLGYWLVASDGGVFTFGDAPFLGSMGNIPLARPVAGMAATASGKGYWLAAADGGVFTFGDAPFFGSLGSLVLASPVFAMAATPSGNGYWLAAADGGIFTFGDAPFLGSGTTRTTMPVKAFAVRPSGDGYWQVAYPLVVIGQKGYYPAMPANSGAGLGRRIVYCNSCQRLWLVEADETVYDSYLVSGRPNTPKPGRYHTYTRELHTYFDANVTMDYFMAFAFGETMNLGFHTIPLYKGSPMQSAAQLGSYQSHGCVRQDVPHAIELWNWAPLNTTVIVTA